ncbi:HEPN domain-containing protein, partial [Riemerella anatipestifer]|uniref:HEPN domain-containing protein n=1 Tax=Riemerella anatipestifer TaxID=34085 RepID=UPI0028678015
SIRFGLVEIELLVQFSPPFANTFSVRRNFTTSYMNNDFIELAKNDIESSEILFKYKKFSNSIYFYHQAVEKVVKYLGLQIGIINENELKRISHNPLKVFSILDAKENIFKGQGGDDFKMMLKKMTDEEIARQTLSSIDESLSNLYEIDNKKSYFQNFIEYIKDKEFPDKLILMKIKENAYYNKMAENFFSQLNIGVVILKILFLNSCLCTKHKLDTYRYSSQEIPNPIEYFSQGNLLIANLPIFIKSIKLCLSQIEKIDWKNKNYA